MRRHVLALVAAVLALSIAPRAMARVATIETTAPVEGHSEEAVKAAVLKVVKSAAEGALAMGLSWVQINQVQVSENEVRVRLLATDVKPQGPDTDGGAHENAPNGQDQVNQAPSDGSL